MNSRAAKISLLVILGVIFLFGVAMLFHPVRRDVRVTIQVALAHLSSPANEPFPDIKGNLTPLQQRIVTLAKQEYTKKPISYDQNVLRYTQVSKEAWCADYVSWVYNQAGVPLKNPNSGSWRIPGTYTLQAYFQAKHAYRPVGTYRPKVGDVAIYGHGQGHAAIVLGVNGNNITTIGGNESGRLRIDMRPQTGKNSYDLLGYGVL